MLSSVRLGEVRLGLIRFRCLHFVKKHQRTTQSHLATYSPFTLGRVTFYPRIVISSFWVECFRSPLCAVAVHRTSHACLKGLTDKKLKHLLCQSEFQEYQSQYFNCVFHTDLLDEKFKPLIKTLVFFLFIENATCRGSY